MSLKHCPFHLWECVPVCGYVGVTADSSGRAGNFCKAFFLNISKLSTTVGFKTALELQINTLSCMKRDSVAFCKS